VPRIPCEHGLLVQALLLDPSEAWVRYTPEAPFGQIVRGLEKLVFSGVVSEG